jgi:hypothetical protein
MKIMHSNKSNILLLIFFTMIITLNLSSASAELVGYWKLGGDATDSSGNGGK